MSEEPQPLLDQRLVRAVANPTRIAILELLIASELAGLEQISRKLGIRETNAHYHAEVLARAGAIEAVERGDLGRISEPLYRLAPLTMIGDQRWGDLSPALRVDISAALLKRFMDGSEGLLPGADARGM